jgi:hypothetical protein
MMDEIKDEDLPVESMIYEIRGCKVMIDSDLAQLYQIENRALNQAVKRNIGRFPGDFMFQLTKAEWDSLRSHFVIFSKDSRKYKPYAFTEQGVAMLSSVINSDRAIAVNIQIMRTFVQMRRYVLSQAGTNEHIPELRKLLLLYIERNDKRVDDIIRILNSFVATPPATKPIGFRADS